jgi:hypothetical protein
VGVTEGFEDLQRDAKMNKEKMSEQKFNRLTAALAIAEEFSVPQKIELREDGRIVAVIHEHWLPELELRLRQIHWRFIHVSPRVGPFRVLALVDSWR